MNINETLYCEIPLAYCVLYYYPILLFFWLQIHLNSEKEKRISSPEYFEMLNGTEIHSEKK